MLSYYLAQTFHPVKVNIIKGLLLDGLLQHLRTLRQLMVERVSLAVACGLKIAGDLAAPGWPCGQVSGADLIGLPGPGKRKWRSLSPTICAGERHIGGSAIGRGAEVVRWISAIAARPAVQRGMTVPQV